MGAPRWTYLVNILVQTFCFIPFGIYALLQYDTLDSFFDCMGDIRLATQQVLWLHDHNLHDT